MPPRAAIPEFTATKTTCYETVEIHAYFDSGPLALHRLRRRRRRRRNARSRQTRRSRQIVDHGHRPVRCLEHLQPEHLPAGQHGDAGLQPRLGRLGLVHAALQHEPGAAELGPRAAQQDPGRADREQGLYETHLLRPRDEHRPRRGRRRPLPVGRSLRRLQRQRPVLERKTGGARQIREGSHRQDQRVQRLLLHRRLHRPAPLDRRGERPADDQLRRQQKIRPTGVSSSTS